MRRERRAGSSVGPALRLLLAIVSGSLIPGAPARAETARINYMLECQGCHLADGRGAPPAVPTLTGSVGRFLGVPRGREYLVRVPGSAQSPLSDAELAAVLNWIVRNFDPAGMPGHFVPFAAAEVARFRAHPLTDVAEMRRELLSRIEASSP